ncbi:MAG: hypothetical protein PF444_10240 [Bacteroidales bacterium]|jgi:hypothetical protein|nr:hypothetical protein [Bacteroidales bacterium]
MSFFNRQKVIAIIQRYTTEGHSPYLVIDSELDQYVLKTPNNRNDKESLIKEFLCAILLYYWEIDMPQSAILEVNKGLKFDDDKDLSNDFTLSDVFYGSKHIKNSIDLSKIFSSEGKVSLNKISNREALLKIALFDIWIENEDRRPSNNNLLLCPSGGNFILNPIDHAFTFSSLSFDIINPDYVAFSDNDSILHTSLGEGVIGELKKNRTWEVDIKEYFYLCIENVKANIEYIYNSIPSELGMTQSYRTNLSEFLFNKRRNQEVFEQFMYIVNSHQ